MTPGVLPQIVIFGAGLDALAWRECQLKDIY
jgi:O-methyltransferase involved in polyketide biosynthesis